MKPLLEMLIPVIVILLTLAAWALFVFIRSPARPTTKAAAIPLVLFGVFAITFALTQWLGRSVPLPLPDQVVVIGHNVVVKNGKKSDIEVWVRETASTTRLLTTPWTKELETVLKQAEQGRQQGKESRISKRGKKSSQRDPGQKGDRDQSGPQSPYHIELLTPQDIAPKEIEPTPEQEQPPAIPQTTPNPFFKTT
jgi:hypothetical protein